MEHNAISSNRQQTAWLMVWDSNPKTYNKPERKTNVNSKLEINEGDILILVDNNEIKKYLQVVRVVSKRKSSMQGMFYYELITNRKVINKS